MSLSFITGAPGSGKTAVSHELAARGYRVYDTDDPNHMGIAGWHNLASGKYVAGFNELEVTEELLSTHIWKLTDVAIERFKNESKSEQMYLCGRLRDSQPVIAASRHIVFLAVGGATIARRLENRAKIPGEVDWGREPWQIERSIVVNQELEAEYRSMGAAIINADRPLAEVVEDVLTTTSDS